MENKTTIASTIDFLKKDIQFVIDKRRLTNDVALVEKLETDKREKMAKLKELTKQLNDIHKDEVSKQRKLNSVSATMRKVDSLNFNAARQRNLGEKVLNKAKLAKEEREKARLKYLSYVDYESNYAKNDPQDMPGMLFLHDTIVKEYGLCPYIKFTDGQRIDEVRELRLNWLKKQRDGGELYKNMYTRLYEKVDIVALNDRIDKMKAEILELINGYMTSSQRELFSKCMSFIVEYIGCSVKSKKMKERYKLFIHNLSMLYCQTGLNLHVFLNNLYKQDIVINDLRVAQCSSDLPSVSKHMQDIFDTKLESIKELSVALDQQQKWCNNTLRNLKNEFYMYCMDNIQVRASVPDVVQTGKYFKRWAVLSETERNDIFQSYADYHVNKHFRNINKKMIEKGESPLEIEDMERSLMISDLSTLLVDAYKEKRLIYRDFKWNTNCGIIENIKVLNYDPEKNRFVLSAKAGNHKVKAKEAEKKCAQPKKVLMSSQNERTLNETILVQVIARIESDNSQTEDQHLENCLERIKTRLEIKKLNKVDKEYILKKYKEVFEVVQNNKQKALSCMG
jgi:hypothetical protein